MKKIYLLPVVFFAAFTLRSAAQCTNTVLDWDYREFFARNNNTIRDYVSLAQSQTQYFAFGANKLTIQHNYTSNDNIGGDNTTHTGESSSYGSGADVEFTGNGTITLTFAQAVTNLRFSLYDIDRSQRADVDAFNGATPINVGLTRAAGGSSVLTVNNNNSTTAYAQASNNSRANTSNEATLNVDIAGPVTSVIITISNTGTCSSSCGSGGSETGIFWLSDISACSDGSFPSDYYNISRPFTGMPSYVITVRNNVFYYIDVATGVAKYLFTDPGNNNYNSLAYDPYNQYLYYTRSLSGSGGSVNPDEGALRRYDYKMDTFGVVLNDARDLGLPLFGQGVESGAAAFYNGNLYWGIEGHSSTAIESIIWRMELNSSNFPVGFSQVYAQEVRNSSSSSRQHDWADFGISNGILYDFDGGVANSPSAQNANFFVQNLLTGSVAAYTPSSSPVLFAPRQTAVDWAGNVYNIGPLQLTGSTQGEISLYNGTNNISNHQTITFSGATVTGSWGDAAEAFRPFCDFGDAPSSYEGADPTWDLAVHERDNNLRIGAAMDIEWLKRGNTNTEDADDGLDTYGLPIFSTITSAYQCRVEVFNNTGSDATLIGWLDYNNNGVFDAGEGRSVTVPSSASIQDVWVSWSGITADPSLTEGSYTQLRLRLTSAANNMTTANAAGYFANGEVEDYTVLITNLVLPLRLVSFNATAKDHNTVLLDWKVAETRDFKGYEVQKSADGKTWVYAGFVPGSGEGIHAYQWTDQHPFEGTTYYRLKLAEASGTATKYSTVKSIQIKSEIDLRLFPNPVKNKATLLINSERRDTRMANISIYNAQGGQVYVSREKLTTGSNRIDITIPAAWQPGSYIIHVILGDKKITRQFIINK